MIDYRGTYSLMTDDQLLNLASEEYSLAASAKIALKAELANRHLGPVQVEEQAQGKPLAQTFNGFGTNIYGKRNPESDGSFITTKWVVFFWIPLIPLKSLRVKYIGPGDSSFLPGWSRKYLVIGEFRPHTRQVISTYSFIALFLLGGWILDTIHAASVANWSALTVWALMPWILRSARRNGGRKSH